MKIRLARPFLCPANNPISVWYSCHRILTSAFPTHTPAAAFMKAVRYIIQNSLTEPIDAKKSRISVSLNTFFCIYSIKGIRDCFYYTYSLTFLLSTLPYSLFSTLVLFSCCPFSLSFSLSLPFPCYYSSVQAPDCLNSTFPSATVACQTSLHIIGFSDDTIVGRSGPSK